MANYDKKVLDCFLRDQLQLFPEEVASTPEEADRKDRPAEGGTQFIIAKNRSGPLATVDMRFDAENIKFYELDYIHEQ